MTDYYCGKDKVEAIAKEFGVSIPGTIRLPKPAKEYPILVETVGPNVPNTLRLQIDGHGQYRIQHD